MESLRKHNSMTHQKGETLPEDQQVYRVKVVYAFLKAGVPLGKIEHFREPLEENAYRITDRRHMYDYIPFILRRKKQKFVMKSQVGSCQLCSMAHHDMAKHWQLSFGS